MEKNHKDLLKKGYKPTPFQIALQVEKVEQSKKKLDELNKSGEEHDNVTARLSELLGDSFISHN